MDTFLWFVSNMSDVEGKRSSGLTAIWLARNRFAVMDKTHQVNYLSVVDDFLLVIVCGPE